MPFTLDDAREAGIDPDEVGQVMYWSEDYEAGQLIFYHEEPDVWHICASTLHGFRGRTHPDREANTETYDGFMRIGNGFLITNTEKFRHFFVMRYGVNSYMTIGDKSLNELLDEYGVARE